MNPENPAQRFGAQQYYTAAPEAQEPLPAPGLELLVVMLSRDAPSISPKTL